MWRSLKISQSRLLLLVFSQQLTQSLRKHATATTSSVPTECVCLWNGNVMAWMTVATTRMKPTVVSGETCNLHSTKFQKYIIWAKPSHHTLYKQCCLFYFWPWLPNTWLVCFLFQLLRPRSRAVPVTSSSDVRMAAACPPGGSAMGKMTVATGLMRLNAQVR